MKVKFWCNSGANIKSERCEVVDLTDFGISDEEWAEMDNEAKYEIAEQWAWQRLDIGFEEVGN